MRHIEAEFPKIAVFEKDPQKKAEEARWLDWSEKYVKGLPTAIYDTLPNALRSFDYITKVGKFNYFEKLSIKYTGAFVMTLVAKKIRTREGITDPVQFLKQKASEWSNGLEGRSFMGGERPNAADIAVFGITRSVMGLRAGEVLEENAAFSGWLSRMKRIVLRSL